jgi:hypothetical protein
MKPWLIALVALGIGLMAIIWVSLRSQNARKGSGDSGGSGADPTPTSGHDLSPDRTHMHGDAGGGNSGGSDGGGGDGGGGGGD